MRYCPQSIQLFDDYIEALSEFYTARQGDARKVELFAALRDARQRYLDHVKLHACRDAAIPSTSTDTTTARSFLPIPLNL